MAVATIPASSRIFAHRRMHAPLAMAIAVGVVCAGVGAGSAVATTADGAPELVSAVESPSSQADSGDYADTWFLANNTGQPIYGYWDLNAGKDHHSRIDFPQAAPLANGDRIKMAYDFPDTTWAWNPRRYAWAHFCFNHMNRNANGLQADIEGNRGFSLTVTPNSSPPTLTVQWLDSGNTSHQALVQDNPAEGTC